MITGQRKAGSATTLLFHSGRWQVFAVRGLVIALLVAVTGCSNLAKPGQQSIEGMAPVGTVSLTETIAVGAAGGKGILSFQG